MLELDINDDSLRYQNPGAVGELRIPFMFVGTVPFEKARENVITNMKQKRWLNVQPEHDGVAVICGNAPSLADTLDEIRAINGTVFACNHAANFLIENGIGVDYQVILDSNPATLNELADAKAHLFASAVDPVLFEKKPDAILWHTHTEDRWIDKLIPKDHPPFTYVGGSSSVSVYTMSLCHVMGFREIHMFGVDSSYKGEQSHAKGDNAAGVIPVNVRVGYAVYKTNTGLKEQARHILQMIDLFKQNNCKVFVHGSGLLPSLILSTT